jgi:hypothetical protein
MDYRELTSIYDGNGYRHYHMGLENHRLCRKPLCSDTYAGVRKFVNETLESTGASFNWGSGFIPIKTTHLGPTLTVMFLKKIKHVFVQQILRGQVVNQRLQKFWQYDSFYGKPHWSSKRPQKVPNQSKVPREGLAPNLKGLPQSGLPEKKSWTLDVNSQTLP